MEIAIEYEQNDEAKGLMNRYRGTHRRLRNLIQDWSYHTPLKDILQSLETSGEVYIERHPRLVNGVVRTDIRSSDIVYFDSFPSISRRTLMYQTKVEYGDYTINHVLGCAHGCDYPCYAMQLSKRYGRVSGREDWMSPKIVGNAMSLLEKELPRLASKIRFVHLSFMTDPFMYDVVNERTYPWIRNLTLSIIRRLNQEGIKVTVLTKGLLPEELADSHFGKDNEYGVTLVSYNPEFHAKYEPFSPCAEDRLSKLRRLSDAGLRTWVSLEPYPTPNIVKQDLMKILEQIDFVDKIIFGKWNYNPEVSRFENSRRFYMDCSDQVIRFCSEKGISFHIKERTPRSSSRTHSLFKE